MRTRIKVCGITRAEDALAAATLGADAIGLIFYPQSPRYVTLAQARAVLATLPPFVAVVALFVDAQAHQVERVLAALPIDILQFHGHEPPDFCRAFRRPYLKAVHMQPGVEVASLSRQYYDARGLVFDTFVVGASGGTGQIFDWTLLPAKLSRPVVLAGGLNAHNVVDAVAQLRPAAVDVCSGIEQSKGIKDIAKMAAFIAGVRHASV